MKKITIILVVMAMVFISSLAFAEDLLYGCVKRTGSLRIVSMPSLCSKGEAQIVFNLAGVPGPAGLKGDTGPQGSQGIQGPIGATGIQGLKGDKGLDGNSGPSMWLFDHNDQLLGPLIDTSGVVFNVATLNFINVLEETPLIFINSFCCCGAKFFKEKDLNLDLPFLYLNGEKVYKPNFSMKYPPAVGPGAEYYQLLNGSCSLIPVPADNLYPAVEEHHTGLNFPIEFPLQAKCLERGSFQ